MKRVFSVKKFEESMKKYASKDEIELAKELWANDCEGLTAGEMWIKHGCFSTDNWMVEVEE